MAEESDIFPIVKILEDINQADESSASSKYIKKEEVPESETVSPHEYFNNALSLIIKSMESIERGLRGIEKEQSKNKTTNVNESARRASDLNNKTVDSKQKPSKAEDKLESKKISSTLTDVEKQRYKSIFELFSKTVEIGKFAKDGTSTTSPKTTDRVKNIVSNIVSLPSRVKDKVSSMSTRYGFKVTGDTPYDFKALEQTVKGQGLKVLDYNPRTYNRDQPIKSAEVNKVTDKVQEIVPKISALPTTNKVVKKAENFTSKINAIPVPINKTVNQVVDNIVNKYREIVSNPTAVSSTNKVQDIAPKATAPTIVNKVIERIKDIAPKAASEPTVVNKAVNNVINRVKEIITKVKTLPAAADIDRPVDKVEDASSKAPVITIINKVKEIITRVVKAPATIKGEVGEVLPAPSKTALVPFVNRAVDIKLLVNPEEKKPEEKTLAVTSNNLTETEKQKYKVIAEVFGKILEIGKFAKGPEADRLKLDTVSNNKPLGNALPKKVESAILKKDASKDTGRGFKLPSTTDILSGLITLALAYNLLNNNISGTLQSLYRTLRQITPNILKAIGNSFTKLKNAVVPVLDDIFSTLGKGISDGVNKLKDKFKPLMDNVLTPIGKYIGDKFTKLKAAAMPVIDDVFSTLGKGISDGVNKLKTFLDNSLTTLGEVISNNVSRLKEFTTKAVDSAKQILPSAANKAVQLAKTGSAAVATGASKAVDFIKSGAAAVTTGAGKAIESVKSVLPAQAGKTFEGAKSAVSTKASDVINFIKSGAGNALQSAKGTLSAGTNKVTQLAKSGVAVAGSVASKMKTAATEPVLKMLQSWFSKEGARKALKGMAQILKPLRGVPIVGPTVELFFGKGQIDEYKKMRASNKIQTDDELYFLAGQRVAQGVAGLLGGSLGAAAANLFTGGVATLAGGLGTLAGGLIGDNVGRYGARVVTDFIIPPQYTRQIGKIVVDSPIKEEELQDFLVKDNKVYKFNNKDEVLGMKTGGAVNNLISSITNTNEKQFSIASRQVKILEEIRDGIKALVSKETNNINNYNNTSGGRKKETRPSLSPFNLRSEFDSMNNIATI